MEFDEYYSRLQKRRYKNIKELSMMKMIKIPLLISVVIWPALSIGGASAQSMHSFQDAYGNMIGQGTIPRISDKDYYISQQSNMADRGDVNAGVNPRGNVDVNPPGFIGDNPFGNSSVPNP
jgi:hypothetical protein